MTQLIDLHQMVVVHPSCLPTRVKELVALAKEKPNTLNYGSYGNGSQPHLLFEMCVPKPARADHADPVSRNAPAITATGERRADDAGRRRYDRGSYRRRTPQASQSAGRRRLPTSRGPTLDEAGFPDVDPRSWFGLFAPRGTPSALVEGFNRDVAGVFADPDSGDNSSTGRVHRRRCVTRKFEESS